MTNLQNLIEKLKQTGKKDEEIVAIIEVVTQTSLMKATNTLMEFAKSTPEALNVTDQIKLQELYEKTTCQTFNELANSKLEESAQEYLTTL